MAIYTKRGDRGETSLYDPASTQAIRIKKDSLRIRAIGSVDELDSFIGVAKTASSDLKITKILVDLQKDLLTIGSSLAGSKLRFNRTKTKKLEKLIDKWEGELPVLSSFILPGGTVVSAHLHVCRSMARRAEREITTLSDVEKVSGNIKTYMNRLSDFLFMLARVVNFKEGIKEEGWKGKKK